MVIGTVLVVVPGAVVAGCGSDQVADPGTTVAPTVSTGGLPTTIAGTTAIVTTVAATTPTPTTATATTVTPTAVVSTTQLTTTTIGATTLAPTTTATAPSAPPCDLDTIVRDTQTQYEGITATDLSCAGDWASWVGQPADPNTGDSFFAVAEWTGSTWELANLGTAGICADGGVPAELWDALGCVE